jgi:hypothetical protein
MDGGFMKKIVMVCLLVQLISGCQSKTIATIEPTRSAAVPTPSLMPSVTPSVTPIATAAPLVERFQFPFHDEVLLFDHHLSDLQGWVVTSEKLNENTRQLHISFTENQGENWITSSLPALQSWENNIDKNHLFTSFNISGPSWIMFISEPSLSMIMKTLYRSDDNGKTWALLGDLTLSIEGDVKGIVFQNEKMGWIASGYRGIAPVPLYHTIDGGKTWSLQKLPLEKGFRYGNVFPPEFDYEGMRGTVKVEYIGDPDNKFVYFETNDRGETWHRFDMASITKLKADKDALEVTRQFVLAWLAKDESKVNHLMEQNYSDVINRMKQQNYFFYSASTVLNDPQGETCIGLRFQTDQKIESNEGQMTVCLRKQPKSKVWKVYMLD